MTQGRWRPLSPHLYRAMHEAAYPEVKAVSRANVVLVPPLIDPVPARRG